MTSPSEEAVERFRRRMRGTDEATLYRNLEAGVYGPAGSPERAVAERALHAQFSEAAQALQAAGADDVARAQDRVEELTRTTTRALWLAGVALLLSVVAILFAVGAG